MTNPVDESDELENVDSAEEVVSEDDAALSIEEDIPGDDESKPVKKKILALEARHKIEDYEIEKQIREALDYFDEGRTHKKYFDAIEKPKITSKSKTVETKPALHAKKAETHSQSPSNKQSNLPSNVIKAKIQPSKVEHKLKPKHKTKLQTTAKVKSKQNGKSKPKNNPKNKAIKLKPHHASKKVAKPLKKVKKAKKK